MCTTPLTATKIFDVPADAGVLLSDLYPAAGGVRAVLSQVGQPGFSLAQLTTTGADAGFQSFAASQFVALDFADDGAMGVAWTPSSSSVSTQFYPLAEAPSAVTTTFGAGADSVDLAWNSAQQEFASFHVLGAFGGTPSTIVMRRWTTDGGLLGTSFPIVQSFATLHRDAVAATSSGYFVAVGSSVSLVPPDGGSANPATSFPGVVRAVATGSNSVGVLFAATDAGSLWFSQLRPDGTGPVHAPTLIDPGSNEYGRLTHDGNTWRVLFVHRPTETPWLASVSATGALESLEPVSCQPRPGRYPSLARLAQGRVAIGLTADSSQIFTTP